MSAYSLSQVEALRVFIINGPVVGNLERDASFWLTPPQSPLAGPGERQRPPPSAQVWQPGLTWRCRAEATKG